MNDTPKCIDSEKALIGSMLLEPDRAIPKINITSDDFYDNKHKLLFSTLMDMYKNDNPMDMITIRNRLTEDKNLTATGGDKYLLHLQSSTIVASHVNHYQKIVLENSNRRKEILIYTNGIREAQVGNDSSDDVIQSLATMKLQYQEDVNIDVLTEQWLDKCEDGKLGHFNWWCIEWDNVLGLLSNELMIFHAPRSTGKTALMLQWIVRAHVNKHRVPLASIEMLKEELCGRFVAHIGRVNSYFMRTRGKVTEDEKTKSKEAIHKLRILELCIRDKSMTIDQICTWARSEVNKGVNCVFIDNLLSISDGGKQYQSKTIMYDHFIRELRNLRDSLKCPIILLAHPNEETGRVAWSKDVENFADVILYMANVPHEGCDVNGKHIDYMHEGRGRHVLIKFQKNRQGISPCASVKFELETQSFTHVKWEDI